MQFTSHNLQSVTSNAVKSYVDTSLSSFIKTNVQHVSVTTQQGWIVSSTGKVYCYKGDLATFFGTNNYTLLGMYIGDWSYCNEYPIELFVYNGQLGIMTDSSFAHFGDIEVHFVYI